jgi:hypothetical protein
MAFIRRDKYPQWLGKILLGSMKFNYLVLLEIIFISFKRKSFEIDVIEYNAMCAISLEVKNHVRLNI